MLTRGDLLGDRYRLDEPIATGGMGEVWRATDTALGRTVAVKVLRDVLLADPGFDARFRAEARTMAALNHPNVVNIYDYGRSPLPDGEAPYLVMAHVDGRSLAERVAAAGSLPADETLAILAQAADALHAAHARGIVHRDVKPANLLVRADGTVVLVDFGVARSPGATSATAAGQVVGTALYMAPEQATGRGLSPAMDIYALGAVGYHCLTGHPPFLGGSALEIAMRHVSEELPPLPAWVPPAARTLIMRALRKNPADRFPDAAAFATAARAAREAAGTGAMGPLTVPFAPVVPAPRDAARLDPPTLTDLATGPQAGARPVAARRPALAGAEPSGPVPRGPKPRGPEPSGPVPRGAEPRRPLGAGRLVALAGMVVLVLLLSVPGLVILMNGAHSSGGSAPADRPASGQPAKPVTSDEPTSRRSRPPTATVAPGAPAAGTTGPPTAAQPTPTDPVSTVPSTPPSAPPSPAGSGEPGTPGTPGASTGAVPGQGGGPGPGAGGSGSSSGFGSGGASHTGSASGTSGASASNSGSASGTSSATASSTTASSTGASSTGAANTGASNQDRARR